MEQSRWPDLPPDVLHDISGRLCNAVNSVPLRFRCVFSKSSYRALPSISRAGRRIWLSTPDATTIRYLMVEHHRPRFHDPLTRAVTHLPRLPHACCLDDRWEENLHGSVYADGTTFLYGISTVFMDIKTIASFTEVLLQPGDAKWTLVEKTFEDTIRSGGYCATYHKARILVTVESSVWQISTQWGVDNMASPLQQLPKMCGNYLEQYSYLLESRGELLWATIHVRTYYNIPHRSSMWVCALEGDKRHFAIDASMLVGHGGSVYFVYTNSKAAPYKQYGVFSYNLVDDEVKFIERLPQEWDCEKCTWLIPQTIMARVQEINRSSLEARGVKRQEITGPTHVIHIERYYEPCFKVLVYNLPLTVKSSQLRLLFSNHGKVFSTEVIFYKKTKRSRCIGHITMSRSHAHLEDALSGLVLEGCNLHISLVKEGHPQQQRKKLPSFIGAVVQLHIGQCSWLWL
ncbi:hypothetical protein VPH35_048299 [Triticum aestivum]